MLLDEIWAWARFSLGISAPPDLKHESASVQGAGGSDGSPVQTAVKGAGGSGGSPVEVAAGGRVSQVSLVAKARTGPQGRPAGACLQAVRIKPPAYAGNEQVGSCIVST